MKRLILSAVVAGLMVVGISAALPVQTRPQPASAEQASEFDHSNCQYPDRWTNPANGCDNSDPAVPECIKAFSTKAGEDACIAQFVADHQGTAEKQQAIAEHDAPFNTAQPQTAQCGGK